MHCTQPNCDRDAVYSYIWPWGATGACCVECTPALQETARALGRELALVPVPRSDRGTQPPPPPSDVDSLRAELESAAMRISELEGESTGLREALELRARELQRTRSQLEQESQRLRQEISTLRAALDAARLELETAAPKSPPPAV